MRFYVFWPQVLPNNLYMYKLKFINMQIYCDYMELTDISSSENIQKNRWRYFWRSVYFSCMQILSNYKKISGKIITFLSQVAIFLEKIPYSKIFFDITFVSTDFQNFYCTIYDKFSTKYLKESILPTSNFILRIINNTYQSSSFTDTLCLYDVFVFLYCNRSWQNWDAGWF